MQYQTDLVNNLNRRHKRNVRFTWLSPTQRAVMNQLFEAPIKPSSITPRRKVVVTRLIRKGLVLRQFFPEDLYILTDEGKELFQQRKEPTTRRVKGAYILFFLLLALVVAGDTWLIATAINEDETIKRLHHEQQ